MKELFMLSSDAVPSSNHVLAVKGTEGLSLVYSFEMQLQLSSEENLDLAAAVGKSATLTFHEPDGSKRNSVHGLLAAVELLEALPHDTLYKAVLVPKLWWLGQNRHSRVFVKEKLADIIDKVLRNAGWGEEDYEVRLRARGVADSYPTLEHVCQYRESDLDFLSRWMEREGVYYYFEEGKEKEKLIITDAAQAHKDLDGGARKYFPRGGSDTSPVEAFQTFRCAHRAQPAGVRYADYNYLNPDLELKHEEATGEGPKVSLYGENVSTQEDAKWIARVRAQELKAQQVTYVGKGRVYGLRPGYRFTLSNHPKIREELLVTGVAHLGGQLEGAGELRELVDLEWEGGGDGGYEVELTAIPVKVQYRPPLKTTPPRVTGLECAVIDGEVTDPYAQLDEHGRYLVRMKFDEAESLDGKASMRVRLLQPYGGEEEGIHFHLKKGTEVMLAFRGGDPDQPEIVGVAPNAHRPSLVTNLNPSQHVSRTGGGNMHVIEDLAAQQYVHMSSPSQETALHLGAAWPIKKPEKGNSANGQGAATGNAQGTTASGNGQAAATSSNGQASTKVADTHNLILTTDGNGLLHTGADLDETIGGNRMMHVTMKLDETVGDHVTQTYKKGLTQKITAEGEDREVTGKVKEVLHGEREQRIEGKSTEKITGALDQTVDQDITISTPHNYTLTAKSGIELRTDGICRVIAKGGWDLQAPPQHNKSTSYASEFCGSKLSVLGLKTELVGGLALGYTANKIDLVGMKFERVKAVAFKQKSETIADISTLSRTIAQGIVNVHQMGMFIVV